MSGLVVGGVVIPVAVSSPQWSRSDAVDRGRMFDGTFFASQTGGATRDWTFSTPPVTQALADSYIAALASPAAKLCSGDILQLPTMCSPELPSGKPTRGAANNLVVLDFMLHESQPAKILLRYSPGDTITGESFTRAGTGYYIDSGGFLKANGNDVKRDAHYGGGIGRTLLLEGSRTNDMLQASAFNNASWVKTNVTVTTGISDPTTGTGACTLTATAANATTEQNLAAGSNSVRTISIWLKRRTGTGTIQLSEPTAGTYQTVAITSSWVRYTITGASASTIRTAGIKIVTNGDAIDAFIDGNEVGGFVTSEIPTTTVAVTRAADSYSLPFTTPPQEMTMYVKFVELGTLPTVSARIAEITSAADANPRFILFSTGNFYQVFHANASTSVSATLGTAPARGDTVELLARLFGDGSVDITQSINGAAATSAAQSAANALAPTWAGPLCWLNSGGTAGNYGSTAIQSFKVVAGSRSLVEMRAA